MANSIPSRLRSLSVFRPTSVRLRLGYAACALMLTQSLTSVGRAQEAPWLSGDSQSQTYSTSAETKVEQAGVFGEVPSAEHSPDFGAEFTPERGEVDFGEVEDRFGELPELEADAERPNPAESEPRPSPEAQLPSADRSGVTGKTISVPKGEGTIKGMEESFSAQLSTGIATFNVPFALPQGRGDAQPSLGLAYSSSGGYDVAGVGWSVGVPFIARQTDKGLPHYDDRADFHINQDRFVFNGGQELVPICVVSDEGSGSLGCSGALTDRPDPRADYYPSFAGAQVDEAMPPWSAGWQHFRPRVEGSFLRFFWSPDHQMWRVQDKSGVTMELGGTLDSLEVDPDAPEHVYRWHLSRQFDVHHASGTDPIAAPLNIVVYKYTQDAGMAYLSDIYYTPPVENATSAPLTSYAHHVHLDYEARTDATQSYRSGWLIGQRWRLAQVDVASKPFEGATSAVRQMVRKYHLAYRPGQHASLLESLTVEGRCATTANPSADTFESSERLPASSCPTLPPMRFGYGHVAGFAASGSPKSATLEGFEAIDERHLPFAQSPEHSLDDVETTLMDVNSDSLPDVLVTAPGIFQGNHGVFFNGDQGQVGRLLADRVSVNGPASVGTIDLSNLNVVPLDADGDANVDLLHMPLEKTYSVYSLSKTNNATSGRYQWLGRAIKTADRLNPKIDLGKDAAFTRVVDVNFDGLVDVVRSTGTELQTFFALGRYPGGDGQFGQATWTSPTTAALSNDPVRACLPWSGTNLNFEDSDIQLADMNGDGIVDITRVRRGEILYWPGRGNGYWGNAASPAANPTACKPSTSDSKHEVLMASSPTYSDIQGTTLRVDDVNGDGLSDLVQVRYDEVDVWLNVNGTSWTKRHIIDATPESPGFANTVRLTDVNGSGSVDLLWGDAGRYQYIDLTGGIRPHLLTQVENGLGKTTELEYVSSASEMLAATRAANAWTKTMPTVSTLVKRVTEHDNLTIAGRPPASYVTEYTYRNPVFEGRQREFRGFEHAESRKLGDANSPTSVSTSLFLLGECADETNDDVDDCSLPERWRDNPREALKGLPVVTETLDEQGTALSTTANQYTLRTLYRGLDGRLVRYAFQSGNTAWLYDTDRFTANTFGSTAPQNGAPCSAASPAANTTCLPTVTIESSAAGTVTSVVALSTAVRQRANNGAVQIKSTDAVDWFGNQITKIAYGEVGVDETITSVTLPTRPTGDSTGWLWRTESSFVTGSAHGSVRRNESHITYSPVGDPLTTSGVLAGTATLRRNTNNPASAPVGSPGLGAPETVQLSSTAYNEFGNPTRAQGANLRCSDVTYDPAYGYLPVTETTWTRGCDNGLALTTSAEYDRGLAVLTDALNVQGQPTRIVYDGFGRLLQMFAPHPTTLATLSPNPSVEIEYFLPPTSGTAHSLIHTKAQDGANVDDPTYLESWAYVDGLGRTITTLSEDEVVEVTTDNQTESVQRWVVGAMQEWDAKSAVRRKYLEFYYTGDPQTFDFGDYPGTYYGRQRYDAFGRQLQTYDVDGTVTLRSKYHALSSEAWDAADLEAGPHQSTYLTTVKDGHGRAKQAIERFKEGTTLVERSTETQFLPTGEPEVITRRKLVGGAPVSGASTSRWFAWDTLGRMVLNVEPNTSLSYAHNAAPNVTSTHETSYTNITAWRYQYNLAGDLIGMSDARGCGANFYFDGVGRLLAEDYFPCATTDQALYSAPTADTLPSGDKLPASSAAGIEVLYTYDAYVPPAQSGLTFDTAVCDPSNGVTAPVQFSKGRLVRVSDLGAESYTVYDGRGRNTCTTTRLTKPYAPTGTVAVPTFANRYAPRWYSKQFTYDAADRVVDETTGARMLLGANNKSFVKTVYSPRGTVKQVQSAYGDLIAAIDRTADGLVTRVEYADLPHTATTYTFDDRRRVHTAVTARAPPSQWPADFETNTNGSYPLLLQDETFTYDVVGNPVTITDNRIPEEWPAGSKPVSRSFAYDDLYRVIKADYQYAAGDDTWKSPFEAELADATGAGDPRRAEPSPHVSFAKRILWQSYQYDWLGNTRTSNDDAKGFYDRSLGAITNGTTKAYQLTAASNGNLTTPINSPPTGSLAAAYDNSGNLIKLEVTRYGKCAGAANGTCPQSFYYSWDEVGRLVRARRWDQTTVPANFASPVVDLRYHYAAGDSRVLKTARDTAGAEVHTAYIFPSLELRRAQFNTATAGDYTLTSTTEVGYLFANGVRLARLAQQPLDSAGDSNLLRVFFELGDHLGSTSVVLDKGTGELVERDTYQVYGGAESSYRPSTWSSFREDYRFTGKEEDVEVGLTYFGKRFYNALLQRWVSPDPLEVHQPGQADANLYAYVSGFALKAVDPLGLQEESTSPPPAAGQDVPSPPVPGSPEAVRAEARTAAQATGEVNGRIDAELMLGARALFERHVLGQETVEDSLCVDSGCYPLPMTISVEVAPTVQERFARYEQAVAEMTSELEASRPQAPTDPELKQVHDRHRTSTAVAAIFDGFKDQLAMSIPAGGRGNARSGSARGTTPPLTSVGPSQWKSAGGLTYGPDKKFGNRVRHVLAHTVPDANKPAHSVFSVGRNKVLGLVDEAWAKRGAAEPGDPGAFVVQMGRTVGTAGETAIRVVVRPGTTEIITAYPVF
jgi:RHS repeat-associated protein